jgi:hypothetical protein
MAYVNTWNTLDYERGSHDLLCGGNRMMQPWTEMKADHMSIKIKRNPNTVDIDSHCDGDQDLRNIHPKVIDRKEYDHYLY